MPRCPECREPVSPFAAGCALCGADLEAARRRQAQRRRPSLPRPSAPPWATDVALPVAVIALVVLAFPLLGVLLAGLMIRARTLGGERVLRLVLWGLVALGVALLLSPATRYGVTWLLLR